MLEQAVRFQQASGGQRRGNHGQVFGKVRDLSGPTPKTAAKSQIEWDRLKGKETGNADQVRKKRCEMLLPQKSPPQVINITQLTAVNKRQKLQPQNVQLSLELVFCHVWRVYSHFNKHFYLYHSTVVSGLS